MNWVFFGLLALCVADPAGPVWPQQWHAEWIDEISDTNYKKSGGQATYNWNNGYNPALWWNRYDGWVDPYCLYSLPMAYDKQCAHIVVGGKRYLYYKYPEQCCYCCNDEEGCGVPPPNFMQNSTYQGTTSYQNTPLHSWLYAGEYQYLETQETNPTDRQWFRLFSATHNYTKVNSFVQTINPSDLQLPAICSALNVCQGGPCYTRRTNNCSNLPITFL